PTLFVYLICGETSHRTMKLRSAATNPHNSAKASAAPTISLAYAARACSSLQGASSLKTEAMAPTAAPYSAARPTFQGEASLWLRIMVVYHGTSGDTAAARLAARLLAQTTRASSPPAGKGGEGRICPRLLLEQALPSIVFLD
ncbi:MAG: hypothetical protein WB806_12115, partial [Xanthobacteraceae bacterium]